MGSRLGIVKDTAPLGDFADAFSFCWLCGIDERNRRARVSFGCDYYRNIEIHHIAKPGRSHERGNLFRACKRCHDVIEAAKIQVEGWKPVRYFPVPTLENVLWLKRAFDRRHCDVPRIAALRRRAASSIDELTPPPDIYAIEFWQRRGMYWPGYSLSQQLELSRAMSGRRDI